MKFGMNEGMATKVRNFIFGAVFAAVFIWAVCVVIKGSSGADRDQSSCPRFHPSDAR